MITTCIHKLIVIYASAVQVQRTLKVNSTSISFLLMYIESENAEEEVDLVMKLWCSLFFVSQTIQMQICSTQYQNESRWWRRRRQVPSWNTYPSFPVQGCILTVTSTDSEEILPVSSTFFLVQSLIACSSLSPSRPSTLTDIPNDSERVGQR